MTSPARILPLDHNAKRHRLAEVVAANVRRLRKEQHMTIVKLATDAHVSVSALNNIEAGTVVPSLLLCLAVAEALDVSLDDLVVGL